MFETRFEPFKISINEELNSSNKGKIFTVGLYNIMIICHSQSFFSNAINYFIIDNMINKITDKLTIPIYPLNISNIILDTFQEINELVRCNYYNELNTETSCTICIIDYLTAYFGVLGNLQGIILRKENENYNIITIKN
jgi:hypothetical protein